MSIFYRLIPAGAAGANAYGERLTETKKPTHIAYNVRDYKAGDKQDSDWTRVGVAWEHKDGEGLDVILDANPVNGRVVIRKNKPKEKATA